MTVACVFVVCLNNSEAAAPNAVRVSISCADSAIDQTSVRRFVMEVLTQEQLGSRQLDVSIELTHVGTGRHADVSARLGLIVSDDRGAMQSRVSGGATVRVPMKSRHSGAVQAVNTALGNVTGPLRDQLAKR